jgi:hypothetical protein
MRLKALEAWEAEAVPTHGQYLGSIKALQADRTAIFLFLFIFFVDPLFIRATLSLLLRLVVVVILARREG